MNNKGFTLVEVISVIMILGLLVIITTPAYNSISSNIKKRNYQSKKNTIESETLSYVEKYFKDYIYGTEFGTIDNKDHCFTVGFLIENGIINSDNEKEEYIENNITGEKYEKDAAYVLVKYEVDKFKMKATFTEGQPDSECVKYEGE